MLFRFVATSPCPEKLYTSYLPLQPYVCKKNTRDCLFMAVLRNATSEVCGKLDSGHEEYEIDTEINGVGGWAIKTNLLNLNDDIDSSVGM